MKKLVWVVAIVFLLTVADMARGYVRANGGTKSEAKADTLKDDTATTEDDAEEDDVEVDTAPNFIVGNFSGKGIDTLECVPYGPKTEWDGDSVQINWEIKSKQGTCKSMLIEGQYEPKMVFEGDLDGDGADEFSYLTNSLMSTMEQYWVFTYKDGVWKWLCEPRGLWTFHYDALCERGADIVEPSHKKGYVTVHYTQYSEDGEHRIRTKQVKVKPTAISR